MPVTTGCIFAHGSTNDGGQVAVAHGLSVNIVSPQYGAPSPRYSADDSDFHAVFRFTAALDVLQQIVMH